MKVFCKNPSAIHEVSHLKYLESAVLVEGHGIAHYVFKQPNDRFKYVLQPRLFGEDMAVKTGTVAASLGALQLFFSTDVIVMGRHGLVRRKGDCYEAYLHPFYKDEWCKKIAQAEPGEVSVYQNIHLKSCNLRPVPKHACLSLIEPLNVSRVVEDPVFVLSSPADDNYSHFVWDTLPLLWYVTELNNPHIKILIDEGWPKYKLEFLDALGFDESRRITRKIGEQLLCKSIYMGSLLGVNNRKILPQGLELLGRLRVQKDAEIDSSRLLPTYAFLQRLSDYKEETKPLKLLFLDRNDDRKSIRQLLNEEDLWEICKKYGFERITPGRMSLAEKRKVYAQADVMVGQYGGGLQNHFLCHPGTRLMVLQSNLFQRDIFDFTSDLLDIPVISLFGRAFPNAGGHLTNNSNFMIDEQQFEKALLLLLGSDYRKQVTMLLKKKVQLL